MNQDASSRHSTVRFLVAIGIGLAGAMGIWITEPYSMFLLGTAAPGGYLPAIALFPVVVILLGVNPLLSRLGRGWTLNRSQLAVILGILLVATVLPGQGVMKMLPYCLARAPREVSRSPRLAEAYRAAGIRQELFPDKIDGTKDVEVAEGFLTDLDQGKSIPWKAWGPPLLAWGALFLPAWMMLVALAMIVIPQWRRNERLPFPLLDLEQSLIEAPEPGRCFAPLFRQRTFWIAVAAVFLVKFLKGMSIYNPEGIPAIPTDWDLSGMFTEGALRHLPYYIKQQRITFMFVGVAFFMSSRVGFSIWFFIVAYALYIVVGNAYMPPFSEMTIRDHRVGAMLAISLWVLWLGRSHWAHVGRCMIRGVRSAADRRDGWAGWLFVLGCMGLFIWLVWMARVQWWWAMFFVAIAVLAGLLIARLVAETGIPFMRLDVRYELPLVQLIGKHLLGAKALWLLSPASLFFSKFIAIFFISATIASPAPLALHALQLDPRASARRQFGFAMILVVVLVLGLVVCGASHVYMNYRHSSSWDERYQPLNAWGTKHVAVAGQDILNLTDKKISVPMFQQPDRLDLGFGHITFGLVLASVLFLLCNRSPLWPLHPIGLVSMHTNFTGPALSSFFIGWLAKVLILRYGGARLYRSARPVFLGLIVGEVLASAYWAIDPAIRWWLGLEFLPVS